MKPEQDWSDAKIRMSELCKSEKGLQDQLAQARVANIGTDIAIANLTVLLKNVREGIGALARTGVKRVVVPDEPEQPPAMSMKQMGGK